MTIPTIDPADVAPLCSDCQDTGRRLIDVLCDTPDGEPIHYRTTCECVDTDNPFGHTRHYVLTHGL